MSKMDPRTGTPIDPSRLDHSKKDETGRVVGETRSRDDPEGKQKKAPVPEVIGKFTADIDATGNVEAELEGSTVQVHSSWVKMHANVSLKPDVDPEPANFKIGWVQNLNSSRRVGVYKNRAGEVRSKVTALGQAPDRRSYEAPTKVNPRTGDIEETVRITVAKPWYDLPEEMSAFHRTIETHAYDRPKHPLPLSFKDDKLKKDDQEFLLIRMEGGESFTTSLKAGNQGEHTLQTWTWNVPWDINLEGITAGAAKTGGAVTKKDLGKDKNLNPNLDGKTAFDQAENLPAFETYDTPEAAASKLATMPYSEFVGLLDKHSKEAPKSYWNMIDALWKSNKQMRVEVWEDKTSDAKRISKDIRVEFAGDGSFTANQEGPQFRMLAHMVLDPGKGMKTPVAVKVNGTQVMTVNSPYSMTDGNGTVKIPGMFGIESEQKVKVRFNIS